MKTKPVEDSSFFFFLQKAKLIPPEELYFSDICSRFAETFCEFPWQTDLACTYQCISCLPCSPVTALNTLIFLHAIVGQIYT